MLATDLNLIGTGIYGVPEASRLTGVPPACIRRWLRGYSYKTASGDKKAGSVFVQALPTIEKELALSFLDLIELKIVNSLRLQKISWKSIRLSEAHAREIFQVDHPFATKTFKTDGRRIFADLKKKNGEKPLIDLADNQLTFRQMVEPHLRDIDFDANQQAARWWPMGSRHQVLLDPGRSFGQPIVRQGVPTNVLAQAFKRESSEKIVANWFEIDPRAVRDAVKFERNLAA